MWTAARFLMTCARCTILEARQSHHRHVFHHSLASDWSVELPALLPPDNRVSTSMCLYAGWRTRHPESLCFSSTGELLLYGPTLWDPRSPRCVHTFDVLTYNPCASTFHPAGLEVIVNAEVGHLPPCELSGHAGSPLQLEGCL